MNRACTTNSLSLLTGQRVIESGNSAKLELGIYSLRKEFVGWNQVSERSPRKNDV